MTERDAFGNPLAERQPTTQPVTSGDPLGASTARVAAAAFGEDAPPAREDTATATATADPPRGPSPTPAQAPPPAAVFTGGVVPTLPNYGPSRTRWWRRGAGLFVLLLFLAPFAIGGLIAYNAFHTVKTTIPIVNRLRDLAPSTSVSTSAPKPAAAPTGLAGASMLRAANLGRALRAARRDPGGRLGLLRVAPARADLQLTPKAGGLDLLQVRADGGRSLVKTPGTGPAKAIIFSQIDAGAPARLVRAAAERLRRSTKAIDYVVLLNILGGPRWSAYFTGGAAFQGDAHGHVTRRIQ